MPFMWGISAVLTFVIMITLISVNISFFMIKNTTLRPSKESLNLGENWSENSWLNLQDDL